MGVNKVERGRLQMAGRVRNTLICLHTVVELEVEIHVFCFDSERGTEIQCGAGNAIVGCAGKLTHIAKRASKATAHVVIKAAEALRRGLCLRGSSRDSKPAQGKQKQSSLTQS